MREPGKGAAASLEDGKATERHRSKTIFDYPESGYCLDDDPVMDELFFLDMMEEDD